MIKPLIVTLSGDLDIFREDELRAALEPTYDVAAVVIDFTAVPYIDSTALGALVRMRRIRGERGFPAAKLVMPSRHLRRILEITALGEMWPIFETLDEALTSFERQPA